MKIHKSTRIRVNLACLLLLFLALTGCASPLIAPIAREEAVMGTDFADLVAHPEKYQGRTVTLGGDVMTVQPGKDKGSLLTVDQLPLAPNNHPYYGAPSGGTFVVESKEWLPSYDYVSKRKVTVTGVVAGRRNGFPLLQASQIRLWEYPPWEKWYYPVPREWYDYDPTMQYWYTPPYFDPYRPGRF